MAHQKKSWDLLKNSNLSKDQLTQAQLICSPTMLDMANLHEPM